jgi:hypothetical protein
MIAIAMTITVVGHCDWVHIEMDDWITRYVRGKSHRREQTMWRG